MKSARHVPVVFAVLAGLLLASPPATAGLGLELDQEAFENAPTWVPEAGGLRAVPRIDLSGGLPPPGIQGGYGSCTGWAVAYAMKTQQEVVDQGWLPDHAARIFSPAFIWNQLNGGRNQGCSISDALQLMQRVGCSTWARMPYRTDRLDYRPSAEAVREAAWYRIRSFAALRTAGHIKEALLAGHVVVVAIRCDSDFMAGSFPVWTRDRRRAGEAHALADAWDAQHRNHAMAVVGYDDTRRAFKLINSWGRDWGENGFCWVSYDLMQRVPNAPLDSPELFLMQAWIAQDVRQRVGGGPPAPAVFQAGGRARYAGLAQGRPGWLLDLYLVGSDAALKQVRQVTWFVPRPAASPAQVTSADRAGQFGVTAPCGQSGALQVQAVASLTDGSTRRLALNFTLAAPNWRQLQLVQSDRYLEMQSGRPTWEWTVRLEGNAVDLGDVADVTYHLHPSFPDPNRTVTGSPENGFALTTAGWGTFQVGATIRFQDGSTMRRTVDLVFRDPVRNDLTLLNHSRYAGRWDGQNWWQWTAYLDGPLGLLRRIRQVNYRLHPSFQPSVRSVAGPAEHGFPMSTHGWGTFEIGAEVVFDDGTRRTLTHQLVFEPLPPGVAAGDGPPDKGGGIPEKGGGGIPEK